MAAREYWDDDEEGTTPCACGRHCAERDYQGNPARGPRAFCRTDRRWIGRAIRGLPHTYVQVAGLLAKSRQQEERVSGSREAPVPLSTQAQMFMRHIVMVTLSWEDQVRAAFGMSNPDLCPGCRGEGTSQARECPACHGSGTARARDGAVLQRASVLLAGYDDDRTNYLDALLSLGPELKRRPVPRSRMLADCEPGSLITIDTSGDAWENKERDGTYAGLEFLRLDGRARAMLGLTLGRRRVAVPCDGCGSMTLIQRGAVGGGYEPVVRCTNCPEVYIGARFELVMGREYEATLKATSKAS